jgi:hypothetical protein
LNEFPVAISANISCDSAKPVFCDGVLSRTVHLHALADSPSERDIETARAVLVDLLQHYGASNPIVRDPVHPLAFVQLNATHDRFLAVEQAQLLFNAFRHLPAAKVDYREIVGGHVSAFLLHRHEFVRSIVKSFRLLEEAQIEHRQRTRSD